MRKLISALFVASAVAAGSALAQSSYPAKPIRFVCVHAPGGGADILSRLVSDKLSSALGQPVVVENRPGASTMLGAEIVAKSAPDGYTLMMASVTTLSINPSLFAKMLYDPVRDFAPVTLVASMPFILTVHPSVPAKDVQELIALAKAQPGKLNYGSAGNGTSVHLAGVLFGSMAGIDIVHVPYKGSAAALTDLVAGQVQMVFDNTSLPYIKSGKLRALGVTSSQRSSVMPELATIAEQGLPGYESSVWYGVVAPGGTPREIVNRLNAEIVRALKLPDVREKILALSGDPVGNSPEEFAQQIRADMAKWAKVVRESGAKIE